MTHLDEMKRVLNGLIGQTIESIAWCSELDAPRYVFASGNQFSMEVHVSITDFDLSCTMLVGDQRIGLYPSSGDTLGEQLTALENAVEVSSKDALSDCVGATISDAIVLVTGHSLDVRFALSNARRINYSTSYSSTTMSILTA